MEYTKESSRLLGFIIVAAQNGLGKNHALYSFLNQEKLTSEVLQAYLLEIHASLRKTTGEWLEPLSKEIYTLWDNETISQNLKLKLNDLLESNSNPYPGERDFEEEMRDLFDVLVAAKSRM